MKQTNKQTGHFDVQHSVTRRRQTCSSISPDCKIWSCWRWIWAPCTSLGVVIHFISFKGKLKMEWKKKETETHRCAATVLRRTEQRWDRCDNQCNISVCIHSSLHFWRKLKWFSENAQFWEQELSCSFIGFFVLPNSQHVATTEFYWFQ